MQIENIEPRLPSSFRASGFSGGIKKKGMDMALLYSEVPAVAAGVFTRNRVRADCVERNSRLLARGGNFRVICANSGNANACTGARGAEDSLTLASSVSRLLSVEPEEVLLASTGVIGVPLPIENMSAALEENTALPNQEGLHDAAAAIMTTDTVEKVSGAVCSIGETEVHLTGIAKGSGMIHPNMATMLGFILTDVAIDPKALQKAVEESADRSFNMISVDGDTSTNDMLLVMANGESGAAKIESLETPEGAEFLAALESVTRELAVMIVRDGEGAGKLIEVSVQGAVDHNEARVLARGVTRSNLVKTAFFGEDANWGRILAAMGASGALFESKKVCISFKSAGGEIRLMEEGSPYDFDEERASRILGEDEITVEIRLADGEGEATAWGCDLSYDYVKINGDYRT